MSKTNENRLISNLVVKCRSVIYSNIGLVFGINSTNKSVNYYRMHKIKNSRSIIIEVDRDLNFYRNIFIRNVDCQWKL